MTHWDGFGYLWCKTGKHYFSQSDKIAFENPKTSCSNHQEEKKTVETKLK